MTKRSSAVKDSIKFWLWQNLIAFDQSINAFLGGWADETLSSRAWRWEKNKVRAWPRKLIDALFWFDRNHCHGSYMSERRALQLAPELRGKKDKRNPVFLQKGTI